MLAEPHAPSSLDRNMATMMALGRDGPQAPPLPQQGYVPHAPVPALPQPIGGVGDAASAALNAAALQTLSMKQAEQQYRVYRGQIMYTRAGILLDGVNSHDTSFLADAPSGARARVSDPRAGPSGTQGGAPPGAAAHASTSLSQAYGGGGGVGGGGGGGIGLSAGGSLSAREPRERGGGGGGGGGKSKSARRPPRGDRGEYGERSGNKGVGNKGEHAPEPSSRAQAVAAADHLRRALLELPDSTELDEEMDLWNGAFQEVVRQVHVHCNERGSLLEAIRIRYTTTVDKLFHERAAEMAALKKEGEAAADAEAERSARRNKHALMFARAAHDSKKSSLEEQVSDGERRLTNREREMRIESDQLRQRYDMMSAQLAEARKRLQELLDKGNRLTQKELYKAMCRLESHDEQRELLQMLLLRPVKKGAAGGGGGGAFDGDDSDDDDEGGDGATSSTVCAPLLPFLDPSDRLELLEYLLSSLREDARLELLRKLCMEALPTQLHELTGSIMLEHVTHEYSGRSRGKVPPPSPESAAEAVAMALKVQLPGGVALDASELTEISARRRALVVALFKAIGEPLEAMAPELHAVMSSLIAPAMPIAPPSGEDPAAFYAAQIANLNAQLATKARELTNLAGDNDSLAARLKKADGEIARLRKQLESALAGAGDVAEAAVLGLENSSGAGDGSGGGGAVQDLAPIGLDPEATAAARKAAAGMKVTATLMRTYKAELKLANAKIAELEAMLRDAEAKHSAELASLRGQLADRDSQLASARSELASVQSELKNFVCKVCGGKGVSGGGRGVSGGGRGVSGGDRGGPSHQTDAGGRYDDDHSYTGGDSHPVEDSRGAGGGKAESKKGSRNPSPPPGKKGAGGRPPVNDPGGGNRRRASVAAPPARDRGDDSGTHGNAPKLGERQTTMREGVPLGSCVLDAGAKPMSTTFLFRLISNLISSKLVADEKILLAGRQPLVFPDYVSYQMITFYGVKKFATRYLQEMYVGLVKKRTHHPRLALFARALQVFPEEPCKALLSDAFVLTTTFMRSLLALMESEKAITKTTSIGFFAAYAQMCTIYVPTDYVLRTVEIAHRGDAKVATEKVYEFVVSFINAEMGGGLGSTMACNIHASKTYEYTKRATIFSPDAPENGAFVDVDLFFAKLAGFYEDLLTGNQRRLDAVFAQFDVDGDGHIDFNEFKKMLAALHDLEAHPMTEEEIRRMYDALNVQGDGVIAHEDLMDMLTLLNTKKMAQEMVPTQLELQEQTPEQSFEQLKELTAGWDGVRASASATDPDEETERWYVKNISSIIKIQTIWAYRLKKMRGNKPSGITLSALGFW